MNQHHNIMQQFNTIILGHRYSKIGESSLCYKIQKLMCDIGIKSTIYDIIKLLENNYDTLAKINYNLASYNLNLFENAISINLPPADLILVLLKTIKGVV